jgi:outer membrane protein assembly factor BamD
MIMSLQSIRFVALAAVLSIGLGACGPDIPVNTAPGEADRLLLERGAGALKERKWATARQYFSELLESYPQSALRAEAKLGVGDSYLGENNTASYVFALNEYREFLAFYPTNPRADYAQLQLGMVHINQMLGPQRDQTETKEAIRELETFFERYPNSALAPQARQRLREAKDRLADWELQVGTFYLNIGLPGSAVARFRYLLEKDPEYTRKDSLYFHLADALQKSEKTAEALPYYERLVQEYQQSEHLEEAKRRIGQLKASAGL